MAEPRDGERRNDWTEYRYKVLDTLKSLDADIRELEKKLEGHNSGLARQMIEHRDLLQKQIYELGISTTRDVTALKTKASQWGGAFGAIGGAVLGVIASLIVSAFTRH